MIVRDTIANAIGAKLSMPWIFILRGRGQPIRLNPAPKCCVFYAMELPPARLTAPRSRNSTAATPITTITVKKSAKVPSALIPVSSTDSASVLFTVLDISPSTMEPTPTIIASDTIARAIGPRLSTPLTAIFYFNTSFLIWSSSQAFSGPSVTV